MRSWFRALMTPRSTEPRARRQEGLLYVLSLGALAASVLWLVLSVASLLLWQRHARIEGDVYVGLEGVFFAGLSYLLTRLGRLRAASYMALFGLLVMQVSSMLLIWKSPLDPTMVLYAVVIAMGGLLLGRRGAATFYILSLLCYIVTAGGLFFVGYRTAQVNEPFTLVLITLSLSMVLLILLLVVHFYIRSMEGSLTQAEEQVRQRTEQLEAAYRDQAEQRARLDVILRNVADGLVVTDLDDCIVLANPAFARMVACGADPLAHRRLAQVIPDRALEQIVLQARREPGRPMAAKLTVAGKTYQAVACALGGPDDPISGVVTALHDITQEMEAIEARTGFVSSVAHELRVPLMSIRGYASLLKEDVDHPLTPEQRSHLDTVLRNEERMATLVQDLLDLCHLEGGRVQMEVGPCSLSGALNEVLMALRPHYEAERIALDVQLPAGLPFVLADARRLGQVLTNLLANAWQYTPAGGRVTVRARYLPPPQPDTGRCLYVDQGYLEVAVQDTGVGIPREDQERIFERFVRLNNAPVEKAGGTGLGLTIVRQLLALQGGAIWVESEPGVGSTFYFTLPAAE